MNYSAKASSKHLLNRVGSRPKINYSRFNLKDKKNIFRTFTIRHIRFNWFM